MEEVYKKNGIEKVNKEKMSTVLPNTRMKTRQTYNRET